MSRKVCIAVDLSQTSQNALQWAARTVVNPGDEVRLMTVLHPCPESELKSGAGSTAGGARTASLGITAEADEADIRKAQDFLEDCKQKVVAQGVAADAVATDMLVAVANSSVDTGRQIANHAESCGCESLVMGSRGLGLSKKALLTLMGVGSVSDYVLKHAHCNVVLYKDKPAA